MRFESNAVTTTEEENQPTETIGDPIENLALSAPEDKSVLKTLIATNSALQKQLQQVKTTKAAVVKENTKLLEMLGKTQVNDKDKNEERSSQKIKTSNMSDYCFNPDGYCHTCGYNVTWRHTSKTCKFKGIIIKTKQS